MENALRMTAPSQSLSEYALTTWTEMTEAGVNPVDGLLQIQFEIEGSHSTYGKDEVESALRLIGQWKEMIKAMRSKLH